MKKYFTAITIVMLTVVHAQQVNFDFTGFDQTYTVPAGVNSITIKMWGAGGGGGDNNNTGPGGGGAYVNGSICVTPGEPLTIVVGARGRQGGTNAMSQTYGGGGFGRDYSRDGGSGGGRSAILRSTTQIAIAGGGGGGGGSGSNGGDGSRYHGGAAGGVGANGTQGGDRSNFSGGAGGCGGLNTGGIQNCNGGGDAVGWQGGNGESGSFTYGGGGGGGGYAGGEGGASGGNNSGGGGGGSSYFSGTLISSVSAVGSTAGNNTDIDNGSAYGGGGDRGNDAAQNGRVVIIPDSPLGAISGTPSACVNSNTQLNHSALGGTWSSDNNAVATVNTTGLVSGVASGTATISYSLTTACGTSTVTQTVTINDVPAVPAISGTPDACVSSTTQLANTSVGGTWSSSNNTVATVDNTGLVSAASSGTADISYAVTNGCGTTTVQQTVTINDAPAVPAISGTPDACVNSTTQLANTTAGGTWSSSNNTVATVDNTGLVSATSSGTADISYAVTNGCGTTTVQQTVTINDVPTVPSISGTPDACSGSTTQLANNVIGGTWSSSNNTVATVDNTGLVSGASSGTADISYAITNGCGTSTVQQTVSINALPIVDSVVVTGALCGGSNTGSLTIFVSGGTPAFSYSNDNGLSFQSNNNFTGLASSTYNLVVTDNSNCSASTSATVQSSAGVSASASAQNTTCGNDNGSVSVTVLSGNAISYLWSSGDTTISVSDLTGATYTVTVFGDGGCTATATATVDTSSSISANIVSNKSIMCSGDSAQICAAAGFNSYLWNTGATTECIRTLSAGNFYVTVTDINGCSAASNHLAIGTYPLPPVSVSVNGDTLSAYNAASYQWYFNSSIIPGATSETYVAQQTGSYTVLVTDTNGCNALSNSVNLTVTGLVSVLNDSFILIYPNPTSANLLFVETGSALSKKPLEIFDTEGRCMSKTEIAFTKTAVDVSQFAAGIYLLKIEGRVYKWIKE